MRLTGEQDSPKSPCARKAIRSIKEFAKLTTDDDKSFTVINYHSDLFQELSTERTSLKLLELPNPPYLMFLPRKARFIQIYFNPKHTSWMHEQNWNSVITKTPLCLARKSQSTQVFRGNLFHILKKLLPLERVGKKFGLFCYITRSVMNNSVLKAFT